MWRISSLKKENETQCLMYFVPYLIYDDIIAIFSYKNKKILHKRIQTPIDILKIWNSNGIINKRWYIVNISNKDLISTKGFIANVELKNHKIWINYYENWIK